MNRGLSMIGIFILGSVVTFAGLSYIGNTSEQPTNTAQIVETIQETIQDDIVNPIQETIQETNPDADAELIFHHVKEKLDSMTYDESLLFTEYMARQYHPDWINKNMTFTERNDYLLYVLSYPGITEGLNLVKGN